MHRSAGARGVLFDLDGTLLDTAPDLVDSLNELRASLGRDALVAGQLAPVLASGSPALIRHGFGLRPGSDDFEALQERFLAIYQRRLAERTRPYDGIPELLATLERHELPWGVVTNKPRWLTQPLLEALGLYTRAACVIAGDDMPRSKPDPAGIELACQRLGVTPAQSVMVGDHARDVEAGHRAGTLTLVALFGYIAAGDRVAHWGADGLIARPDGIRRWLVDAARPELDATA